LSTSLPTKWIGKTTALFGKLTMFSLLSAFRLNHRIERRMVCSFVNLVPLTVAENKRKNGRYDPKQLNAYKKWWRRTFKRRDWRQRLLFDPYLIPDPRIILECAPLRRQREFALCEIPF
jgi:hypothetical protein